MNPWLIAALWVGLALFAAMLSIRVGIAVALVEIPPFPLRPPCRWPYQPALAIVRDF
jgi:hypothetical protein